MIGRLTTAPKILLNFEFPKLAMCIVNISEMHSPQPHLMLVVMIEPTNPIYLHLPQH